MEYIKQIFRFIELGKKQFLLIAATSFTLFISLKLYPDSFDGIPEWVTPTILIFGIASVTSYLFILAYEYFSSITERFPVNIIIGLAKKWSIRKHLLELDLDEIEIFSRALARENRNIRLNPDKKSTLTLEKKGLIVRDYYSFDGYKYKYEIEADAWEKIITMKEFELSKEAKLFFNAKRDPYTGYSSMNNVNIISQLPINHPSVIAFRERVRKIKSSNSRP